LGLGLLSPANDRWRVYGRTGYGAGGGDVYLIKTDSLGDTLWKKTFGGSSYDYGYSVQQTADGGYIVAGSIKFSGLNNYDVYLIKTDSLGDTLWTRTYGDDSSDAGMDVRQTTDGGYIVVGYTVSYGSGKSDVYLIKTDSVGDTLWTKTFGGSGWDWGWSVRQTTDGGYIIAGYTDPYNAGPYDVYLIKTDSLGDMLWTKTFGGSESDYGESVQQTTDGGYIVAGFTRSYGAGRCDVYLIKTDCLGDTLWTKTYGGSLEDYGHSVQQTTDGGYIITGQHSGDVYLLKTDPQGVTIWEKTFGGNQSDEGYSVQQTTDGGYIVVGETKSYGTGGGDVYLLKIEIFPEIIVTSPNGGEKWLVDSTYNITWTSYETSGAVKIEYSLNNGMDWTEIVASTPDTGAYPWNPPDTMSYNCLVRISDTNGTLSDISNSVFTIYSAPFIVVTYPGGGETWYNENIYSIRWESAGTSGGVKIEYSINNGLDWTEIIASTYDDGWHTWNPPDTVSDSCLICISDTNGSISDMSDSVFSLVPGSGMPIGSLEVYSLNVKATATGSQVEFTYNLPEKANDIKFTLYNIAGLKIKEENLKENPAGFYSGRINLNGVSKGIYFIRMEANGGKFTQTKKFVLM
jgi:hypothetical protein